jgi:hypothetical protein
MDPIAIPPNPFIVDGALALPTFEGWFFLPGDWAIYGLARYWPAAAVFLGVGPADYGGTFAGFLAWTAWILLALLLIAAASTIRSFDRTVTGGIVHTVREFRRRVRLVIVFVRYRHGLRDRRLAPTFDVREPTVRLRRHMR